VPRAPRMCGHQDCIAAVAHPARFCDDHSRDSIGWNNSPRTASSGRTSTRAWKLQRAKALQRDSHQCQIRGPKCTVTATEVDHVVPVYLNGSDELGNLQSTCHKCHVSRTAAQAAAARG
jgi:5-methylcytosine-specific restriction protein A